jgi:hypothetical protein
MTPWLLRVLGRDGPQTLAQSKCFGMLYQVGEMFLFAAYCVQDQKLNRNANCPTRGFTEVLLITPNVAEPKLVSGSANCG